MGVARDRVPKMGAGLSLLALLAGGATCSNDSRPGSPPPPNASSRVPVSDEEESPRVGNPSNTGMDTIPDWNALARDLRERVGPRLPEPLPTDHPKVCADMLDAARAFYSATEVNPEHRHEREAEMDATRVADLSACVAQTSIAAATCVQILLGDQSSEFPWLLDQCNRAYPRE